MERATKLLKMPEKPATKDQQIITSIFYIFETGGLHRSEMPFLYKAWPGHLNLYRIALSIRSIWFVSERICFSSWYWDTTLSMINS